MPFYRLNENELRPDDHFDPEAVPRAIAAVGFDIFTKGMEMPTHAHRKAELLLTLRGVVRCEAGNNVWIVPPRCAVWIPSGLPHRVTAAGNVEVYLLFVEPGAAAALPRHCCAMSISPLLERLLLSVTQLPVLYDIDGADGRLATVLLDQLAIAPLEQLKVPMPVNAKLRQIAAAMMADPADRATIDEWGRRMAVAPRTLTRALKRETGMSFGRWREQLHILIALERLDNGASVQAVAFDLGYEGVSAFVTMFRRAVGQPPARYRARRRVAA